MVARMAVGTRASGEPELVRRRVERQREPRFEFESVECREPDSLPKLSYELLLFRGSFALRSFYPAAEISTDLIEFF